MISPDKWIKARSLSIGIYIIVDGTPHKVLEVHKMGDADNGEWVYDKRENKEVFVRSKDTIKIQAKIETLKGNKIHYVFYSKNERVRVPDQRHFRILYGE